MMSKRWYVYGLVGLVFGIFDWFYLDWLSSGLGPNLGDNPFVIIPIIVALNYGIWLVPVIPVAIYEARRADAIKGPILAGVLTWSCAMVSYYAYYGILLSLGKLPHLDYFNVFNEHNDGFWREYWDMFNNIILGQFLEWILIAVVGGSVIGALAWWILRRGKKLEETQKQ
jgi:hypothetical protein